MTTRPLETIRRLTPLGIELWDFLTDAPVTDGLTATAYPVTGPASPVTGVRTPSGVLAFHGLPGLHDAEYPDPDGPADLPSSPTADFDVLVRDARGRFNDVVLRVTAPLLGVATAADALADCPGALSFPEGARVFLFSAPSRPLPAGTGAIRAQILARIGEGAGEQRVPAPYAVVKVDVAGGQWVGVADRNGAALVPVPYPAFGGGFGGSLADSIPPGSHGTPTYDQVWPVTVEVSSEPGALEFPARLDEPPRLGSVLCQAAASVWLDTADDDPQPQLTTELTYGRDLVLATTDPGGRRELLIDRPAP